MNKYFKYTLLIFTFYSLLALIFLYSKIFPLSNFNNNELKKNPIKIDLTKKDKKDKNFNPNDLVQSLNWEDYKGNTYEMKYSCPLDSLNASQAFRDSEPLFESDSITSKVYAELINHDQKFINKLILSYKELAKKSNITNRIDFAKLIVTSIQCQPYYLVHPFSCNEFLEISSPAGDSFVVNYHKENRPCSPNVNKNGIFSPTEFFMSKKGDCDTRTVACYAILKKLGYDVAIINTNDHSILGINTDEPDDTYVFESNGKRFYLWELTAEGWRIGSFDPTKYDKFLLTAKIVLN